MIILRQRLYAGIDPEKLAPVASAAILSAIPGAIYGSVKGEKLGLKKSDKKDIEDAGKKKEKELERYIRNEETKLKEYFPDGEEGMDNLDKVEYEMSKDAIKEAKEQLKQLKQGDYENVHTKKSEKYSKIGGVIGGATTAGLALGGYALAKRLKRK